jgi:hypothetical protein
VVVAAGKRGAKTVARVASKPALKTVSRKTVRVANKPTPRPVNRKLAEQNQSGSTVKL